MFGLEQTLVPPQRPGMTRSIPQDTQKRRGENSQRQERKNRADPDCHGLQPRRRRPGRHLQEKRASSQDERSLLNSRQRKQPTVTRIQPGVQNVPTPLANRPHNHPVADRSRCLGQLPGALQPAVCGAMIWLGIISLPDALTALRNGQPARITKSAYMPLVAACGAAALVIVGRKGNPQCGKCSSPQPSLSW